LISTQSIGEFLPIVQCSGDAIPDTRVGKSIGTAGGIGSARVTFHYLESSKIGKHGGMELLLVEQGISAVVQDGTHYRVRVTQLLTGRGQEGVVGIKNVCGLALATVSGI
jgi:hypothetical protein